MIKEFNVMIKQPHILMDTLIILVILMMKYKIILKSSIQLILVVSHPNIIILRPLWKIILPIKNIINEIIVNNLDIYSDGANSACIDIIKCTNAYIDNTKCAILVTIKSTNPYTDNIKTSIIVLYR